MTITFSLPQITYCTRLQVFFSRSSVQMQYGLSFKFVYIFPPSYIVHSI
jgi:hypothetical protein